MPVSGTKLVAGNLRKYGGGFLRHVNNTMKKVDKLLYKEVRKNISRTTFSLEDLKREKHPYARKYGEKGKETIINPYYQVHKRTGKLRSSEKRGTIDASFSRGQLTASAYCQLDEKIAPHVIHVIYGTSKMIPRPVLDISKDNISSEAHGIIKKNLKDFTYGFKPVLK